MDYMLKSSIKRFVVNDYIENDPLSEENLNKTLDLANRIRLLSPQKSIWLYSGYTWDNIFSYKNKANEGQDDDEFFSLYLEDLYNQMRKDIIFQCDVLVDGKYIETQHDITLKWRGSKNQRVIDIQKSLQKGDVVLWTD